MHAKLLEINSVELNTSYIRLSYCILSELKDSQWVFSTREGVERHADFFMQAAKHTHKHIRMHEIKFIDSFDMRPII